MDRWRWLANLATFGNGLAGVGAIAYISAGNPTFGMLLIAMGVGLDGLDGLFARRGTTPPTRFGRAADSVADAVTFGLAPAFLVTVHTIDGPIWSPWQIELLIVAALFVGLAFARLAYFSWRGYQQPYFLGVPTPQSALAVLTVGLFVIVPAFFSPDPPVFLALTVLIAIAMVLPVRYPKIRGGARLRLMMGITGGALALALVPLQFGPASGSIAYLAAFGASLVAAVGLGIYYFVGPMTVDGSSKAAATA